jgi:hypothetical protein
MADAQTAKEELLSKLMAECGQKLDPRELQIVQGHRQVLLDRDIVRPATVRRLSYEQLLQAGLTPGAADLLKSVFPSAGGCQRARASIHHGQGSIGKVLPYHLHWPTILPIGWLVAHPLHC